jgi:hypothetical protein
LFYSKIIIIYIYNIVFQLKQQIKSRWNIPWGKIVVKITLSVEIKFDLARLLALQPIAAWPCFFVYLRFEKGRLFVFLSLPCEQILAWKFKMNLPGLLSFPNEVLCLICDSIISLSDLYSLKLTCRRFLEVIRTSNIFRNISWKLVILFNKWLQFAIPLVKFPWKLWTSWSFAKTLRWLKTFYDKKCFKRSCKIEAQVTKTLASS